MMTYSTQWAFNSFNRLSMSMPYQRSHYLAAAAGHHLEPLARSEREKEVEFELAFPFGIVVGQLQNHN